MINLANECQNLTNLALQVKIISRQSAFYEVDNQPDCIIITFADKDQLREVGSADYIFTFNDVLIDVLAIKIDDTSADIILNSGETVNVATTGLAIQFSEDIDEESGTFIVKAKTVDVPEHVRLNAGLDFYPALSFHKDYIQTLGGTRACVMYISAYLSPIMFTPVKLKQIICPADSAIKYEREMQNIEFDIINNDGSGRFIGFYKGGIIINAEYNEVNIYRIMDFVDGSVSCALISSLTEVAGKIKYISYEDIIIGNEYTKNFIFDKSTFVGVIDDDNLVDPYSEGVLANVATLEEKNAIIEKYVHLCRTIPDMQKLSNYRAYYDANIYSLEDLKKLRNEVFNWVDDASETKEEVFDMDAVFLTKSKSISSNNHLVVINDNTYKTIESCMYDLWKFIKLRTPKESSNSDESYEELKGAASDDCENNGVVDTESVESDSRDELVESISDDGNN